MIEYLDTELTWQPWQLSPYRPVSWLEMLQFSARMFFWAGVLIERVKTECLLSSTVTGGDQPIFALSRPLDERTRNAGLSSLDVVEKECRNVGLNITAETAAELRENLCLESPLRNYQWLSGKMDELEALLEKEIKGRVFMYIAPERVRFFPRVEEPFLFGERVNSAFPSTYFDICESGACLATMRSTACVFHLMRVLEIGLTALGKVFDVSLAHTNWGPAIEEIESKIRNMHKDPTWKALSDCKEQQEFYSQAASHFGVLKDAWRNYTAHKRGIYTEERAGVIFEQVKAFTQTLSERLSE